MILKKLSLVITILLVATRLIAAEGINNKDHQLNFFIGNFDFSDDKQKAILVGFQHQNENLYRDTFLGNVSPITGGFVTENSAVYVYTGIEWNVDMGEKILFTPSFANSEIIFSKSLMLLLTRVMWAAMSKLFFLSAFISCSDLFSAPPPAP